MSKSGAPADQRVAELAALLRDLRVRAGMPSVNRLAALTERMGGARVMPRATIQDKLSGATALRLEHVLALVAACAKHAASIGAPLPDKDRDEDRWRNTWYEMRRAGRAPASRTADAGKPAMPAGASNSPGTVSSSPSGMAAIDVGATTQAIKREFAVTVERVVVKRTSRKVGFGYSYQANAEDLQQNARVRIEEEMRGLIGQLSATLARELGPKGIEPNTYGVLFPGGAITCAICEDLRDQGETSYFWLNVSISVEFRQLDLLQLPREQMVTNKLDVVGSSYFISEILNLGEVAQALHGRGVHIQEWTAERITLNADPTIESDIAIRPTYNGTEIHLAGYEITDKNADSTLRTLSSYLEI